MVNIQSNEGRVYVHGVVRAIIRIGNYTVREVLMKNRTRAWRNVYNTASA